VVETAVQLRPEEYSRVQRLAYEKFGLALGPGKEEMVVSRLTSKMRQAGVTSFSHYLDLVEKDAGGESLVALIDALTTNHTSFFRERQHFDYLSQEVLPNLPSGSETWFWSAASSTGEEPYSLAMWLLAHGGAGGRFRILATDISTRVLDAARRGVYPDSKLADIPPDWRTKYLLRGEGKSAGFFRIRPEVRQMVEFTRLNLVTPPLQLDRTFPVIFCRNVMIYFDAATQERLIPELGRHLWPGGYLYVGHSESLNRLRQPLTYVRPAVYRNVTGTAGGALRP
jgi:chemotaxis protein methyltransferase CheR